MSERQKTNTVRKIIISIIIIIALAAVILGITGYRYITNSLAPVDEQSEEVIEVEIPQGANRRTIASILEDNEVINSAMIFEFYARAQGENNFQAGSYLMSPSMSVEEILEYLNAGGTPIMEEALATVTIPEGIWLEDIAERVGNATDFLEEDFMALVENEDFIATQTEHFPELLTDAVEASEVTRYTLEGYLFPATYEVFEETTLESLTAQMISRMNQAFQPHYETIGASDFNVHEILTLATYIEREGTSDEDRKEISGVFYNRLEAGMPLQTDPSVAYALGEHRERTLYVDLEVDSPYNTYMYRGVGAGPINSPSESAINAAVNPNETDYMYFLANIETGDVYFSETYEQHLKYQNEHLRNNN